MRLPLGAAGPRLLPDLSTRYLRYLASQERLVMVVRFAPVTHLPPVGAGLVVAAAAGTVTDSFATRGTAAAVAAAVLAAALLVVLERWRVSALVVTDRRLVAVRGTVGKVARHVTLASIVEARVDRSRPPGARGAGRLLVTVHGESRPSFAVPALPAIDSIYFLVLDLVAEAGIRRARARTRPAVEDSAT